MTIQIPWDTSRMSTPSQEPPSLSFAGTSPASSYGGAATIQDDSFEQYISFDDGVAADPQDPFYTYLANDASLSTELSTSFAETGGDLSHGQLLFHPAQPVHKEHSILAGKRIGQRNHQTGGHHPSGRTDSKSLEARHYGRGSNPLQVVPWTSHRDCNSYHQPSPRCSPCTTVLPQDTGMFQGNPTTPSQTPRALGRSMQSLAAPVTAVPSQSNGGMRLQAPSMGTHGHHCYGTLSPSHPAPPQVKPNQHHPVYLHMSSMNETCVDPAELTSSGHNSSDESNTPYRSQPTTPANTPAPGRSLSSLSIGNAVTDFASPALVAKSSEPWPYPLPGAELPTPFPSHASAPNHIQTTAAGGQYNNRLPSSASAAPLGTTSLAHPFDSRFHGYNGGYGHDLPESWTGVQEHQPTAPGHRHHTTSGQPRHQRTTTSSGGARNQASSRHRSTLRGPAGVHPGPKAPASAQNHAPASSRRQRRRKPKSTGNRVRHSSSSAAAVTTASSSTPQHQEVSSPPFSPSSPPPPAAAAAASGGGGGGGGGIRFVNFTPEDGRRLMAGVAPSGSSKTRARRDREAEEQKQQLMSEAYRQAALAVGLHHHHHPSPMY
ncbi:uncharacterized protein E0L32_000025 [Thyridium curvatum]|uniref:Developmental regulatory protein wetA n=1 Tax=Thyridium curvatum TaxID=1093900 RepID=A0A507BFF3_9PEZI|nr:uncharacterized protein E0L32_000025 [Thyridium curvatum]TPX15691.1 hypothetical protein E0L32_000025 [Thyridium curvatum]